MSRSALSAFVFCSCLAFGACATAGPKTASLDSDDNFTLGKGEASKTKVAATKAPKRPSRSLLVTLPDGRRAISRPALKRLVAEGAQSFIRKIRVRPTFRQRRFDGWRVLDYVGPGTLQRGDIVRRVNGKPIERPEQVMALWQGLTKRDTLVFELVVGGERRTVTLPIVDAK